MCSICLEDTREKFVYLEEEHIIEDKIYTTLCECNIKIHFSCLKVWIKKHKKCPICLKLLNQERYVNYFILFLNLLFQFVKFVINLLFCIYLYELYKEVYLIYYYITFV